MDINENIKTLFREIEVYRSHSLFEEARGKCQKLGKLIRANDQIKNKQELLNIVAEKIRDLKEDVRRAGEETASAQMSKREHDLVKKLFVVPKKGGDDSTAMEGAIALLVFGQFRKALGEFNELIKKDSLRVVAAKNIIRCHVGLSSLVQHRNPGPLGQVRVQRLCHLYDSMLLNDQVVPTTYDQGVTNEPISKINTNNLALPVSYCLGAKISVPGIKWANRI